MSSVQEPLRRRPSLEPRCRGVVRSYTPRSKLRRLRGERSHPCLYLYEAEVACEGSSYIREVRSRGSHGVVRIAKGRSEVDVWRML